MSKAYDIEKRSKEIEDFILRNDTEGTISRLLDFTNDFDSAKKCRNEAILIGSQFHYIEEQQRKSLLSFDEFLRYRAKLILQTLEMIESLRTQDKFAA